MDNMEDFTDGKKFIPWIASQPYRWWYLLMTVFLIVIGYHQEWKVFFIMSGVVGFMTFLLYRTYKKMQKGESG